MNRDRRVFLLGRNLLQYAFLLGLVAVSAHFFRLREEYVRLLWVFEGLMFILMMELQISAAVKEKKKKIVMDEAHVNQLRQKRNRCQGTISSVVTSLVVCDFLYVLCRYKGYYIEYSSIVQQLSLGVLMFDLVIVYASWLIVKSTINLKNSSVQTNCNERDVFSNAFIEELTQLEQKMNRRTAMRVMYDKVPASLKVNYRQYMETISNEDSMEHICRRLKEMTDVKAYDEELNKKRRHKKLDLMKGLSYVPQIMSVELITVDLLAFITLYTGYNVII